MDRQWPQNHKSVEICQKNNNVIIWVTIAKFTLEKTKDDMTNITSDTAAT